MDDPNINPAWDAILGHHTDVAVLRLLALVIGFIILGGTLFWSIG